VRLWFTVFLVLLLLFVGLDSKLPGIRESGIFATDPPSPYFHFLPRGQEIGKVLVVHGLDANKEVMNLLCRGMADAGFNVYAMDMPGHGASTVGFNTILARQAVNAALDVLGPDTIAMGHSLGGALLLDLANDRSFGTLVLLSPAPTAVDQVRADRILVLSGQFDLPAVQSFAPELEGAVSGSPSKVEWHTVPWSGHSGYLLQPESIREIVAWLGGNPSTLRTRQRLNLLFLEIFSVLLIPAMWFRGKPIAREPIHIPSRILSYISSCVVAVLISGAVVVLNRLRLFSTAYLISFVFLVGITQLPWCFRKISIRYSKIIVSLFAAACVIGVGGFVGSELVHLTLSGGRWWRFGAIALAVLPLTFADEVWIRPIRPWWKAAAVATLTRILIGGFALTGVLTMNRNDAFLALIVHFVVLFWIGLWLAGELLRRNIQDPLATAVFTAVVQAWVFAAIFVLV